MNKETENKKETAVKSVAVDDKPLDKLKKATILSLAAALLWVMLWYAFPMEFYSLFFMSKVGTNILLLLLSAVVIIPFELLFSKVLSANVRTAVHLPVCMILMVGFIYLYSTMLRFTMPWLVFAAAALYIGVNSLVFIMSRPIRISKVKNDISRSRLALFGAVNGALTLSLYFVLFMAILHRFAE